MNKLICSLFVILLWCQPGYAQSMLSLNDYFKKNPKWTKDPISVAIEYEWFVEACEDEYKTYPIKFKLKYF